MAPPLPSPKYRIPMQRNTVELVPRNEDLLPAQYEAQPVGYVTQLTPRNAPVPIPDFLQAEGWKMNREALTAPTPKDYRKVARNKDGMVMYRYAPIAFFIKRANEVWGEGNWGYEIADVHEGTPGPNGNFDITIMVQFVAPGLFRPLIGVGTSTYYANNAQESRAKTVNAALTSALKSALKQLGIGRDVEEDDPEVQKVVEGRITAIGTIYKRLCDTGKAEQAKAIVRKYAKTALLDSGELLAGAIDFEKLEPLQRGLQDLVIAAAVKKAEVAQ